MANKIECSVCLKEIEVMDNFNGEPMCRDCYHDPENYVFDNEEEK